MFVLDGIRGKFKEFTQPAVFKPSLSDVQGQRSLEHYYVKECEELRVQELRDCGLNEQEITLWSAHCKRREQVRCPELHISLNQSLFSPQSRQIQVNT